MDIAKRLRIFLAIVFTCFALFSCDGVQGGTTPGEGTGDTDPQDKVVAELIIPDSDDLGRGTAHYSELEYSYPDTEALITGLTAVTDAIENQGEDFESLLGMIEALEPVYADFLTAYSYLSIETAKDSAASPYAEDYLRICEIYPTVIDLIEEMSVAAATSAHAQRFEDEYFGEGFIEEYGGGERYTDAATALLTEEARLEAEYNGLSTATVTVEYDGRTGSVDEILAEYARLYGDVSAKYVTAKKKCAQLYEEAVTKRSAELLVELIKVRRLIADELGYESYTEYAYEQFGHSYSEEEMDRLTKDIADHAVPIYQKLYHVAFKNFFAKYDAREQDTAYMLNTLCEVYGQIDESLAKAYNYMLHFGLFDVSEASENRRDGAFTVYLHGNASPFVFVTAEGCADDYRTIAHEFGHFADMLNTEGSRKSLDVEEIASVGLELLTLLKMESRLEQSEYKYLLYSGMEDMLVTLIIQGLYTRFEHYAYELSYNEISEQRLSELVAKAADEMGLNSDYYCDVSAVIIPHVILYPFYVQSYLTSTAVSLDIYFAEQSEAGAGMSAYKAILSGAEGADSLEDALSEAGLRSPFESEGIRLLMDKIYFSITGSHYYKNDTGGENAA